MIRRTFEAILVAAVISLAVTCAMATEALIPTTGWTAVGSGTVVFQSKSAATIYYVASDSAPAASASPTTINLAANTPFNFYSAHTVWIRAAAAATTIRYDASTPSSPQWAQNPTWGSGGTLASLSDVCVTEGAGIDGDVLSYNYSLSCWAPVAPGAASIAIGSTITGSPTSGYGLYVNGSALGQYQFGTGLGFSGGVLSVTYGTTAGTAAQGNNSRIVGAVQSGGPLNTPSSGNASNLTNIPAANLTGNVGVANLNGGTGASSLTYWRGDGTWATPSGTGTVTSSGPPTQYQIPAWTTSTNLEGIGPCSTTTVLHGQGASSYPSCAQVSLASDVTGSLALASLATGALPSGVTVNNGNWSGAVLSVANGGTGTASPGLVAGTNITSITGTWPNQTINAAGGSGPGTGTQYATAYWSGTTALGSVGPGTAGYVLTSNGPSAAPTFQAATVGGVVSSCSQYSVGVYLATGTTINCSANLTLNGATLAVGANGSPGTVLLWGNLAVQSSSLTASTYSGATSFVMPYSGTANDVLLSAASTATETNKTFSGASNVWQGGVVGAAYGGTGVNNGSFTTTLGGNYTSGGAITWSGAYSFTGTLTGATSVTFPTSGTLMGNPMTTAGDMIIGGASGVATRVAIGSTGTCWTSNGTTPSWGSCSGGGTTLAVGTTGTSGGAAGQIMYDSGSVLQEAANFTYDSTNHGLQLWNATGTNYEEIELYWLSNVARLDVTAGGTGTYRNFQMNVGKSGNSQTYQLLVNALSGFDVGVTTAGYTTVGNYTAQKVNLALTLNIGGNDFVQITGVNGGLAFSTSTVANSTSSMDTSLCRVSAGVLEVSSFTSSTTASCNAAGVMRLAALQATGGNSPTLTTGSCSGSSWTGGATAGKFTAPACAAGTIILSGLPASSNGYICEARDQTTSADTLVQTANSTTSCTLTATTAASDVVVVTAIGF